jgi:1-acyl-sn-glycerol-3-phosphate acyltransferase
VPNAIRSAVKLIAIGLFSLATYLFLLVTAGSLGLIQRLRRAPVSTGHWRTRIFRRWSRGVARLLGMRAEVHGTPPRTPFVLVSNHLSYVDVILLGGQLSCVFVAKAEVDRWPLVGALCRSVDTVFIDRKTKRDIPRVTQRLQDILADGRGVVLFPEGTSTKGEGVLRFRPGLLAEAARSGRSVSYASLSYKTPPGSRPARLAVCWWGDMPFPRHLIRLLGLPGFEASLTFGEEPIRETDRKLLATRLQRAVERQFQAVV